MTRAADKPTGVKLSADAILRYRDELNGMNFTRAMGWHWTTARREHADGTSVVVLNRVDRTVKDGFDTPRQSKLDGIGDRVATENHDGW